MIQLGSRISSNGLTEGFATAADMRDWVTIIMAIILVEYVSPMPLIHLPYEGANRTTELYERLHLVAQARCNHDENKLIVYIYICSPLKCP